MTHLPAEPGQPVVAQPAVAQPAVAKVPFTHTSDCEVSMGTPEPVCSCPRRAVTAEPVAIVEAVPSTETQEPCVGNVHQPGCGHRVAEA